MDLLYLIDQQQLELEMVLNRHLFESYEINPPIVNVNAITTTIFNEKMKKDKEMFMKTFKNKKK